MAEITVLHDSKLYLHSTWRVVTGSNGVKEIVEGPSWSGETVTFQYKIPSGAQVINAYVHSEWSYPTYGSGFYSRSVNGTWVPDDTGNVAVEIDPESTSFEAAFRFRVNGNTNSTGYITGETTVQNIYLMIIYKLNGIVYYADGEKLVPYQIYRAENDRLVPYQLFKAVDNKLIQY